MDNSFLLISPHFCTYTNYYAAHLLNSTKKELETERGKVAQLKRDMEGLKRKTKAEQEKSARLVNIHLCLYIQYICTLI